LTAGRDQPAPARAPCPPSPLGLRRHARGLRPIPAPGTLSISPTCPTILAPSVRRDYDHCAHRPRLISYLPLDLGSEGCFPGPRRSVCGMQADRGETIAWEALL